MGSFLPPRSKPDLVQLARLLEQASNAGDHDALGLMVSDDVVALDAMSRPVTGRSAFVGACRELFETYPDLAIVFESFTVADNGLLIHGRLREPRQGIDMASLWCIEFEGPLVKQIQAFRAANAVSLAQVARGAGIAI